MYGSPTTKELKKKYSSRLIGGVEMGSRGGEDLGQASDWRTRAGKVAAGKAGSPTYVQINWEEQLGSKIDLTAQLREMKPQNL